MPSSYTNVVLSAPNYLATGSWSPKDDREWFADLASPGVVGINDFLVSFVSGLTVQTAAGIAYIKGGNVADQGMYRQAESSTNNITVGTANPTNPRLDQIILRVLDQDHDTSGSRQGVLEVIPGTATAGATLANRNGAANLNALSNGSLSYLLLADVLVLAGASSIGSTNIGDKRSHGVVGLGNMRVGPFVELTHSANKNIPTGTLTALNFNTETYDPWNCHDNNVNNTRYTCPVAGIYHVSGHAIFAASAAGDTRRLTITKNGTDKLENTRNPITGSQQTKCEVNGFIVAAAGDYIEIRAFQDSGAGIDIITSATSPIFQVNLVGAVV
jgi:hypothetical protein